MSDLSMDNCRGEGVSLFGVEGKRWRLERCELAGLDGRGLRLTHARVTNCAVARSEWARAALEDVAFEGCDLEGIGGAGGLGEASMDVATVLSASTGMARHLGITVVD